LKCAGAIQCREDLKGSVRKTRGRGNSQTSFPRLSVRRDSQINKKITAASVYLRETYNPEAAAHRLHSCILQIRTTNQDPNWIQRTSLPPTLGLNPRHRWRGLGRTNHGNNESGGNEAEKTLCLQQVQFLRIVYQIRTRARASTSTNSHLITPGNLCGLVCFRGSLFFLVHGAYFPSVNLRYFLKTRGEVRR